MPKLADPDTWNSQRALMYTERFSTSTSKERLLIEGVIRMEFIWDLFRQFQISDMRSESASLEERVEHLEAELHRTRHLLQSRGNQTSRKASMGEEDLKNYPDLMKIFDDALSHVGGSQRRVWYEPAAGFDSRVEHRKALLLGGAHSPAYLVREPDHSSGWIRSTPYEFRLFNARVLLAESVEGEFTDWIPFLEDLAHSDDALLIVSPRVETVFLVTFIVNTLRDVVKSLKICPVHPGERTGIDALVENAGIAAKGKERVPCLRPGEAPEKSLRKQLPVVEQAWVRRDATRVSPGDEEVWSSLLRDIAVVHVGGRDFHEQQARLLAAAETLHRAESRSE